MTDDKPQFSSPACFLDEADDVYSGYAPRAEIVAFLNELLEAERAGSRVTLESARAAGGGPVGDLLAAIQKDEARWCAMLLGHVKALGAEPTANMGAFYGKAMAIADMGERIRFLNRGQGWVVKRHQADAGARPRRQPPRRPQGDAGLARSEYRAGQPSGGGKVTSSRPGREARKTNRLGPRRRATHEFFSSKHIRGCPGQAGAWRNRVRISWRLGV